MRQDISIIRGTSNSFMVHINDADGNPFIVENDQSVVFAVKKNIRDKAPILIKKRLGMLNPGKYWLGIYPTDTLKLLPGKYYYDVGLDYSSGNNFCNIIEPSEFIIKPNVSEME